MKQPSRRKLVPRPGERVETPLLPLLGVHKKQKLHSCHVYAEELIQRQAGSLVFRLVFLSPGESRLVDSVGYVFLVSPNAFAPTILPPLRLGASS